MVLENEVEKQRVILNGCVAKSDKGREEEG